MGQATQGHVDDVGVSEVWDRLRNDPAAVLVDVRTRAEWAFVGIPDLTAADKQPVLVEWQSFPDNRENVRFVESLSAELAKIGTSQSADIFFICRSGSRSKRAALAMTAAGYRRCHNVVDGFEGPLDPQRHRGGSGGWKAAGLPWFQG